VCLRKDKIYVSLSEHVALQLDVSMMKDHLTRRVNRPKAGRVYGSRRRASASEVVVVVVDRVQGAERAKDTRRAAGSLQAMRSGLMGEEAINAALRTSSLERRVRVG